MDFKKELSERQSEVNNIISAYLPEETGYQKTVIEAMNYSVRAGGKRLRPVMMHELYRIFSDANEEKEDESLIGPFLAAIEMIHTYSLVHDDLPAMDNDSLRRGLPTTHVKFGHAMGVLAGDGLLNYSVETACRAFELGKNDEKSTERNLRVMRALKILYEKAGIYGMIGGQTLDVLKDGQPLDADEIAFIYDNKTCALIEAAVLCGAVLGGAEEKDFAALSEIDTEHEKKCKDYMRKLRKAQKILNGIESQSMRTFVQMKYVMDLPDTEIRKELNLSKHGFYRARQCIESAPCMAAVKWQERYILVDKQQSHVDNVEN